MSIATVFFLRLLQLTSAMMLIVAQLAAAQQTVLEHFSLADNSPFKTFDPFLFCVHHRDEYPAGTDRMGPSPELLRGRTITNDFSRREGWSMYHGQVVPGFPAHPHRGFETITITLNGTVDHSDSLRCTARYGGGDVQWLTAGRGVQHAEMFPLLFLSQGNPLELLQIWINLPRRDKMCEPNFTMLWDETLPRYTAPGATVRVIAGNLYSVVAPAAPRCSWAARAASDVAVWLLQLLPHAAVRLPYAVLPTTVRALYVLRGGPLKINGETLSARRGGRVDSHVELRVQASEERTDVLVLQGVPIGEPVVQRGPFVMSTDWEVSEAFREFRETGFGGWPWRHGDQTHPRETSRHATCGTAFADRPIPERRAEL